MLRIARLAPQDDGPALRAGDSINMPASRPPLLVWTRSRLASILPSRAERVRAKISSF